jgi:hypothetical protein
MKMKRRSWKVMVLSTKVRLAIMAFPLLLTTASAMAQDFSGGVGMVNAGFISTPRLRSSMKRDAADSVRFGNKYTMIGVELYYRNGKAIVSLSGDLGLQASQASGEKLLEPSLWIAHAGFGWVVSGNSTFCIYPSVGLGFSGSSITEHTRHTDTHIEIMKKTTPSVDVSFHFDYMLLDPSNDNFCNGVVVGIKTGYNIGVISPSQFQGWYLTVSVGGLAFMTKKG